MPKLIDLTGRVFGALTVMGRAPMPPRERTKSGQSRWFVACSCGQNTVMGSYEIRHGSQHCGCRTYLNLTGQRFGKLVALEVLPADDRGQGRRWRCRCDCGKLMVARAKDLRDTGNTTSCGCRINRPLVTRGPALSPRQLAVLVAMAARDGTMLQRGLAPAVGISDAAMHRNVTRLEGLGLLVKRRVPQVNGQGSQNLVALTRKGRRVAAGEPLQAPVSLPASLLSEHPLERRAAA